jgi:hypothetical protein
MTHSQMMPMLVVHKTNKSEELRLLSIKTAKRSKKYTLHQLFHCHETIIFIYWISLFGIRHVHLSSPSTVHCSLKNSKLTSSLWYANRYGISAFFVHSVQCVVCVNLCVCIYPVYIQQRHTVCMHTVASYSIAHRPYSNATRLNCNSMATEEKSKNCKYASGSGCPQQSFLVKDLYYHSSF